mgnify:CR=1 FL=1
MTKIYNIKSYLINDFREWEERGELILSPKFQRRRVWSEKAKSYLIDTILRGLPLPPIFIREKIDLSTKKTIREVIDGQQRLATILDYLKDGLKVSKTHNEDYGGLYFGQLPEDIQNEILQYELTVNVVLTPEDKEILGIFARLNTYTVPLNKNELWNANYFGLFKQTVHSLARDYYTFWVESKILSEQKITRMGDVDLVSELVIAIIDGIQNRKVIEKYYKKFDDEFEQRKEIENFFKNTIDTIGKIYYEILPSSYFNGLPPFYTLFCVIFDLLYGLKGSDNTRRIKPSDYPKIKTILQEIDSILDIGKTEKKYSDDIKQFLDDCKRHTTVKEVRERRHRFLIKFILDRLPNV